MTTATRFDAFATKNELESAYVRHLEVNGMDETVARIVTKGKAVYVPHVYRGGWVIRGFGFSVERIGKYIPADRAGNPEVV